MSGGCLCGAVRYEIDGPQVWGAICHCRDCQRISGGAYMPVMGVRRGGVRITGDVVEVTTRAASGGPANRFFCPRCGSVVFGGRDGPPEETMSIYVGTLDDPSVFRPGIAIFTKDRPAWAAPIPGLNEFEAMPG